jgi:hypothetical protein
LLSVAASAQQHSPIFQRLIITTTQIFPDTAGPNYLADAALAS